MTDEIRPALTPEQWDEFLHRADGWGDRDPVTGISPSADAYYKSEWVGDHGTAAACLYGQPFGFTEDERDKLARLSEALDDFDTGWLYNHGEPYEAALRVVVAKIAALLPPEGTNDSR